MVKSIKIATMKASKKTTDLEKQKKSLEEFDVTDGKTRDEKAEQI